MCLFLELNAVLNSEIVHAYSFIAPYITQFPFENLNNMSVEAGGKGGGTGPPRFFA